MSKVRLDERISAKGQDDKRAECLFAADLEGGVKTYQDAHHVEATRTVEARVNQRVRG